MLCRDAQQAALAAVKAEEQSVLRDITMLKEYMETNVVTLDNKHFSARYRFIFSCSLIPRRSKGPQSDALQQFADPSRAMPEWLLCLKHFNMISHAGVILEQTMAHPLAGFGVSFSCLL